jgi:hypothetical protein
MIWIVWLVSLLLATAAAIAYVGHIYRDARATWRRAAAEYDHAHDMYRKARSLGFPGEQQP